MCIDTREANGFVEDDAFSSVVVGSFSSLSSHSPLLIGVRFRVQYIYPQRLLTRKETPPRKTMIKLERAKQDTQKQHHTMMMMKENEKKKRKK